MHWAGAEGLHYHNAQYLSYATRGDVVVKDGILHLLTRKQTVHGTSPVGVFHFTEGMINSYQKFYRSYGYFEIDAKFPVGNGIWPAFWLLPENRTWPPEIDVAEWFATNDMMHEGLAYGPDWEHVHWYNHYVTGRKPTNGWNIYAVLWRPHRMTFYTDGQPTYSISGQAVPSVPMYIVLNNGVASQEGRSQPAPKSDFEVKWVRVYAHRKVANLPTVGKQRLAPPRS